ncbi:DUF342 domain-containing protein [Anoxynatronum buryatiense]|uniref:Flagellar Assembly Protein A N-terminal region domain-containing protein n=1 Tax=Anoxynatronum buryatiense TaxID=489973 RepID=A0AA46AIT4_9CLOT|nr:FapA family protein [Anoxynatronum buryatiense]SMP54326.1 hypothetical protein SAMN06296020_105115 [Anoxynatronum buryatiense]
MIIYTSETMEVTVEESAGQQHVWVNVLKGGLKVGAFEEACRCCPRIKVTNFPGMKEAFDAPGVKTRIGEYRPLVEFLVSKDQMKGYLILNQCQETPYAENREAVQEAARQALMEAGVTTGIMDEVLEEGLRPLEQTQVAAGIPPVQGTDAKITYFQLTDKKPVITSDGKVDNYEVNLFDRVDAGAWLGEKIHATKGMPGRTIFGESIPAKPGRDYQLKYDPKSVMELKEIGKTTLRAQTNGAVRFLEGKIGVENHLVIEGNVDYNTGHIRFDGYVTIKGTVEDLFSVKATKDIAIQGPMGIGAVGLIHSVEGSVSVTGGMNGKGKGKIIAGNHVYIKYVNEGDIEADGEINIGLYALDSKLKGGRIVVSQERGRIIGGSIEAEHLVVAGTLGNSTEKATVVKVAGFDRTLIRQQMDVIKANFNETIVKAKRLKKQLEILESNQSSLDQRAKSTYEGLLFTYEGLIDEINRLNSAYQRVEEMLSTRGEGEVKIMGNAYPNTTLEIKNLQKVVKSNLTGSLYFKDNKIHLTEL